MDKYHLVLFCLDRLTDKEIMGLDQQLLSDFLETFMSLGKGDLDPQTLIETAMKEFIANY